jgi:uncharacterized membrane protein YeaQ/YmgE (transglycosylase-associated protein family)
MNFVIAIVVGLVIGGIGGFVLRQRLATAIWLAPALAVAGALVASILATLFGDPGYGWKEATLQVVLAVAGVAAVAVMATRRSSAAV